MLPVSNIEHRFEVTIVGDELSDLEIVYLYTALFDADFEFSISESKRIILFEGISDIKDLIKQLADIGLAEDIGVIKEITEYYPIYEELDN
jgi:hypothetical protein